MGIGGPTSYITDRLGQLVEMGVDFFMTAQEAKDYGIIDVVVTHRDGRPS